MYAPVAVPAKAVLARPPTSMHRTPLRKMSSNADFLLRRLLGPRRYSRARLCPGGTVLCSSWLRAQRACISKEPAWGCRLVRCQRAESCPQHRPSRFTPGDGSGSAWWQGGYRRDGALNWKRWVCMPYYKIVLWIMAGVAISVILPILRRGYPRVTAATSREFWRLLWDAAKPYLLLGIGSTLTAILIIAGLANAGIQITTWHQALLLGYFSDSTLQKLKPD